MRTRHPYRQPKTNTQAIVRSSDLHPSQHACENQKPKHQRNTTSSSSSSRRENHQDYSQNTILRGRTKLGRRETPPTQTHPSTSTCSGPNRHGSLGEPPPHRHAPRLPAPHPGLHQEWLMRRCYPAHDAKPPPPPRCLLLPCLLHR